MANLKLSMEVWPNMPWGRLEICGCAVNSWGKIPLNELVYKVKEHGYTDGKAFEGGKAEKYSLKLGSGQFIPGFEEQIVGKIVYRVWPFSSFGPVK